MRQISHRFSPWWKVNSRAQATSISESQNPTRFSTKPIQTDGCRHVPKDADSSGWHAKNPIHTGLFVRRQHFDVDLSTAGQNYIQQHRAQLSSQLTDEPIPERRTGHEHALAIHELATTTMRASACSGNGRGAVCVSTGVFVFTASAGPTCTTTWAASSTSTLV
jgi:hypothetical protein